MDAWRLQLPGLLKAKGYDLKAASVAMGRNPAFLQQFVRYEKPKKLSEDDREALAGLLGVSPDDLRQGPAPAARRPPKPDHLPAYTGAIAPGIVEVQGTEYVSVGRYDASLSAGPGSLIEAEAEPLGYMLFEAQWIRALTSAAPPHLAIVRVDGDSMVDTLFDGDYVMIDRSQRRFGREGIYALQVGDSAWVKRLSLNLRDRLVRIISDNNRYPTQELPEDDVVIIGRIIWIVGRRLQ